VNGRDPSGLSCFEVINPQDVGIGCADITVLGGSTSGSGTIGSGFGGDGFANITVIGAGAGGGSLSDVGLQIVDFDLNDIVVIGRKIVCSLPTVSLGGGADAYAIAGGSVGGAYQADFANGRFGTNFYVGVGLGVGVEAGPFIGYGSPITNSFDINAGVTGGGGFGVGGSYTRNIIGTSPGFGGATVGRFGTPTIYGNGNINGAINLRLYDAGC
jgi:hypothetical protein